MPLPAAAGQPNGRDAPPSLRCRRSRTLRLAASALTAAAAALWCLATLCLVVLLAAKGRAHTLRPWPPAQLPRQLAGVLPVLLAAFALQPAFFGAVRELGPPATSRRMRYTAGAPKSQEQNGLEAAVLGGRGVLHRTHRCLPTSPARPAAALMATLALALALAAANHLAFSADIDPDALLNFSLHRLRFGVGGGAAGAALGCSSTCHHRPPLLAA